MTSKVDKQLEDIEFHQDFIEKDSSSPLHLIREKEMEITGRVLKAKREAEEIIAEARRKAAERASKAESEGDDLAKEREKEIRAESVAKAKEVEAATAKDLKKLAGHIETTRSKAVKAVVDMATDV
jgi:vacuolar-type H+-ATPase subunit H